MTMRCTICSNSNRLNIDRAIAQGKSYAMIANEYSVSWQAVRGHAQDHLSRQLVKSQQVKEALSASTIIGDVEDLITRTKMILAEVEATKKYDTAIRAIAECRGSYELLLKIAVALHQSRQAELEQESMQNDFAAQEDLDKRLKILTTAELLLLEQIQQKLETQDKKMIIIPDHPDPFVLKRGATQSDIIPTPEIDNAVQLLKTPNNSEPAPVLKRMRPGPIPSTQIPSTPWAEHPLNRRRRY